MPTNADYRGHAIAAGIFFIIATVFLFVAGAFYGPGLNGPDVLASAAASRDRIALGILIELSCVVSIPLIAVALYPVLRQVSGALAVGYVAFRTLEAAIFAGIEIDRMLVLELARSLAEQPAADGAALEILARTLTGGGVLSGTTGPIYNLVFVVGMLMLNYALWTSRLVPRAISGWGLVSALVLGALAVAVMFTPVSDVLAIALVAPLAVQEMVLALWLIVRGFDRAALMQLAGAPAAR